MAPTIKITRQLRETDEGIAICSRSILRNWSCVDACLRNCCDCSVGRECRRCFRGRLGCGLWSVCVQPAHRAAHCLRLPAGRYRALVLVGSLAKPALFPENRQAAKSWPPRTRDGTPEFPAPDLLPLVVGFFGVRTGTPAATQSTVHATLRD